MAEKNMNSIADVPAIEGHRRIGPAVEPGKRADPSPIASSVQRVSELEIENQRLHRLVAELLLKNQQLRAEIRAREEWSVLE
jgi:hypothetical protein